MTVDRKSASKTLNEIARLLEVRGENVHRVRAFANAARTVERIDGDLGAMIESGEILQLRGIGKGTAAVLEEIAAGSRPQALEDLESEIPTGVREMLGISGLGPKKVRALWHELGLTSIGELEYACRENRLVELAGFGAKTQAKLLDGIRFLRTTERQCLMNEASSDALNLADALKGVEGVEDAVAAGEVRRCQETVGMFSVVVTAADARDLEETVVGHLARVVRKGDIFTGVTEHEVSAEVRVAARSEAAAALLWSTGSDDHLDLLSKRADAAGLQLHESGLWRGDSRVECADEPAVYEALGCSWVPPELREGGDEIELAATARLPELVEVGDLLGILHNHTTDSDGAASVEEMALAAREHGWEYFGVADHSPAASYANGVDSERLRDQWRRIDDFNQRGEGIRVVKGLEADILPDGSLDIPEGCEGGLEYVVASVHSGFRLSEEEQTDRIVRAVSHPACRVLGHPTGRLLLARPGYAVDLERVLQACAEHGVAAEINASPYRLDLDWKWAKRALELGLKLVVNPDAHSPAGLDDVRWGLAVARKAGATAADLVNCMPIEEFLKQR